MAASIVSGVADESATQSLSQLQAKLDQLKASATKHYALKSYSEAAEHYSEAAELQDEINGEMSLDNADLLYQYGRCLYHVAVSQSDVLGGKVASTEKPQKKKRKTATSSTAIGSGGAASVIGDAVRAGASSVNAEDGQATLKAESSSAPRDSVASKPFFQITGDENWTDSEEEEADDDAQEEGQDEDDDDFATAYEILDVARVLLTRKLAALESSVDNQGSSPVEIRQTKERLADTHDLQAEISLENERFQDAINDTRDSLMLKMDLYPQESSLIAEAHFKLSLALEFASVTTTADAETNEQKVAQVDESLRKEAALEMERAIASCRSRISKEEAELEHVDAAQVEDRKKAIADVKDMVVEMEQRLVDLRGPGVSLSAITGGPSDGDGSDPLRGILGAMLGESKEEQRRRVADATATANDLTGLVKQKKKVKIDVGTPEPASKSDGKRKLDDAAAGHGGSADKRPRTETD